MYCSKCGRKSDESASFCKFCGNNFNAVTTENPKETSIRSVDEIKDHLKNAKILEDRIYTIDCMVGDIDEKIYWLKVVPDAYEPRYETLADYISVGRIAFICCMLLLGFYVGFCALIIAIVPIIGIEVRALWALYRNSKEKKKYNASVAARNSLCRSNEEKIKVLECKKSELLEKKSQAEEYLKKIYSADIIYPKYRNFVAVVTIYEYFVSGRCASLTGYEGAYNLYESELRQKIIIDSLNNVMQSLEQIKQNQYMLYQGICDMQRDRKSVV